MGRDFVTNFGDIVQAIEEVRVWLAATCPLVVDHLFQWHRNCVSNWCDVHLNVARRFPL